MNDHRDPVTGLPDDEIPWFDDEGEEPPRRPVWWRWVAVVVAIALVVATPFVFALYRLLN